MWETYKRLFDTPVKCQFATCDEHVLINEKCFKLSIGCLSHIHAFRYVYVCTCACVCVCFCMCFCMSVCVCVCVFGLGWERYIPSMPSCCNKLTRLPTLLMWTISSSNETEFFFSFILPCLMWIFCIYVWFGGISSLSRSLIFRYHIYKVFHFPREYICIYRIL